MTDALTASILNLDNKVRRKEVLGSMCDQRARILQDQISVIVNHALLWPFSFPLSTTPKMSQQMNRNYLDVSI
ncbi:hypothetical protein IC575_002353 [Cucumis melo]